MRKDERMCGFPPHKKGRGDWGLVLSSHCWNGGSYRRMAGVKKGKYCRGGERGLLLQSLFAEKQSDGHDLQLEMIWIWTTLFNYEGTCRWTYNWL